MPSDPARGGRSVAAGISFLGALVLGVACVKLCGSEARNDDAEPTEKIARSIVYVLTHSKHDAVRTKSIEMLFLYAQQVEGESQWFVEPLVQVLEKEPALFMAVASRMPAEFEAFCISLPSSCFTDFTGEHDLAGMERRRVALITHLNQIKLVKDEVEKKKIRSRLVEELTRIKVHRVN
jgi:hypothetical protein